MDAAVVDAGSDGSDSDAGCLGDWDGGIHGGCEEEAQVLLPMLVDALVAYYEGVGVCIDQATNGCTDASTQCTLNSAESTNTPSPFLALIDWNNTPGERQFRAIDFLPTEVFCQYGFVRPDNSAMCADVPAGGILYEVYARGDDDGDAVTAVYKTDIVLDDRGNIETRSSTVGCSGE